MFSSNYSRDKQITSLHLALNAPSAGNMQRASLYQSGLDSMQYKSRIQVKCIYLPCLNYYVLQQFLERRNRHSFHILWHEENVALKEKSKTNWFLKDNSISTRPQLLGMTDRCRTAMHKPGRTPRHQGAQGVPMWVCRSFKEPIAFHVS